MAPAMRFIILTTIFAIITALALAKVSFAEPGVDSLYLLTLKELVEAFKAFAESSSGLQFAVNIISIIKFVMYIIERLIKLIEWWGKRNEANEAQTMAASLNAITASLNAMPASLNTLHVDLRLRQEVDLVRHDRVREISAKEAAQRRAVEAEAKAVDGEARAAGAEKRAEEERVEALRKHELLVGKVFDLPRQSRPASRIPLSQNMRQRRGHGAIDE